MSVYSNVDVPVRGGLMRVGVWDSDDVAGGAVARDVVLALHGVTASHQSWPLVAERLADRDGVRVVAADLRGRGRSGALPGPWGMAAHANDAAAVLDALDTHRALVVGHSMGGFVAVVLAHRHPKRVRSLVLIDGGLPLSIPPGISADQLMHAMLGPAAARLAMSFPSRHAYQDFWREHPALGPNWSEMIANYVDYDLVGEAPRLHSSANYDAVAADSVDLHTGSAFAEAWPALAHDVMFLRAPRGILAEPSGLYPTEVVESLTARVSRLRSEEVGGVNHYTITMSEGGADAVAAAVRAELARPTGVRSAHRDRSAEAGSQRRATTAR